MDKLFGDLKGFFKSPDAVIDSVCFRLHYKFTMVVLIAFSILVTSKQYIGDPIDCISKDDIPEELLDTFCWIHTTFSIEQAWNKTVGEEIPYPGVDKHLPGERKVHHAYYQWVCLVLFLQAALFYTPRYLWRNFECHKISNLVSNSDATIAGYLYDTIGSHRVYSVVYLLAETMNFINVVGQMYLMDVFLGGEFTTYGTKVIQFTEWDWSLRDDPMIRVFPRLTKCTFHRFGSSGDVQKHDAMCILPINIVNEKIYVFLWFWFVILAVISGIQLIYRSIVILSPTVRRFLLERRGLLTKEKRYLKVIMNNTDANDWIVLSLLFKNMDYPNIRALVKHLARKIDADVEQNPEKKGLV